MRDNLALDILPAIGKQQGEPRTACSGEIGLEAGLIMRHLITVATLSVWLLAATLSYSCLLDAAPCETPLAVEVAAARA